MDFTWDRPPIASSAISAVLPAYQAEKEAPKVLKALVHQLDELKRDYEILVVDDGSSDGTRGAVQEVTGAHPRVRCLEHAQPQGYGACLRTGLAAAQYPLLLTIPADGTYEPEDFPRLLGLIDQADLVLGHRLPRPTGIKYQFQGWSAFLAFGLWLEDAGCHYRLYRRSIFPRIPIQSNSCFADVEILAKANFLGYLLAEVEVNWKPPMQPLPRVPGASTFADARRVFFRPDFGPAKIEEPRPSTSPSPS